MRHCFWIMVVVLALVGVSSVQAEVWPDPMPPLIGKGGENDVALIVAIEDYPDIPDVPGAARNAKAWETYFRNTLGLRDIIVLSDKEAAHYTIRSKLQEATGRVKAGGKLWFVFIGHGAPSADGTDGLLVGAKADATAAGIYENSLPRAQILGILEESRVPSVLVLDACFSGVYGDSGKSIAKGLQPLILVKIAQAQGQVLVLSAGKADQFAGPLPGDDRPAFSYLLLRGLSGEGDSNVDGRITAGEAVAFASNTMGSVALGRSQNPQLEPGENSDWLLTPQVDPSLGCSLGQTRSADTDGQCCWPGQSWSKTKNQCLGQPDRCPPGLGRLANTCGPCPAGQTLQADMCETTVACPAGTTFQNGVCVQARVEVTCPQNFELINGVCVEKKVVVTPPQTCPTGTHLEGERCVNDAPPDPKETPQTTTSSRAVWGWVTVGTGLAFLAAGSGTYAYASSVAETLEGTDLTQSEAANNDELVGILNIVSVTGFAVGGTALLTGVILLLVGDDETTPVVNVSSDGQNVLFGLGGRF